MRVPGLIPPLRDVAMDPVGAHAPTAWAQPNTSAGRNALPRVARALNRARAKSWSREVPADSDLFRLYSDYLHEEYGLLDCDYVFVNLWGSPVGAPMTYASVDRLVRRLRERTGIAFSPHRFRHSYATGLLRRGVAAEVVQHLLGHASISTTVDTYSKARELHQTGE